MEPLPPARRTLSRKLVYVAIAFCAIALAAIGYTLYVSWKLEGGAAAINDLGSQRMRTYRIAYLMSEAVREPAGRARAAMHAEMQRFDEVLAVLQRGDPARPLVMPREPEIVDELAAVGDHWLRIRPAISRAVLEAESERGPRLARELRTEIELLVGRIDALVGRIERHNAGHLELLRYLQLGLIALAIAGTVALIYLMFMLVVRPIDTLSEGMRRLTGREFGARVPVETRDELGELAVGFNRMADEMQQVYQTLEQRVAEKTQDLAQKNREVGTLYDIATLLSRPGRLEDLCREFLLKLQNLLGATAGAVRLIDPGTRQIHLYVHEGLQPAFARDEQCLSMGECFCGEAAQRRKSIIEHLAPVHEEDIVYGCQKQGYQTVAILPIRFHDALLGIFNLYFMRERIVTRAERRMLEAVGRHLGAAIENQRLIARMKEMAVEEERQFLARELHDSIAQSLAFLNIEAQMLSDALKRSDAAEARSLLDEIRKGIHESYENVRELLVHFRTRIKDEDIASTIRQALERFSTQTGVRTRFTDTGTAAALPVDSQLQVLHILQEALSNVRKHAQAQEVTVEMQRNGLYQICVSDDGVGFDPHDVERGERHIGLRIMRERAERIGATVTVESAPGKGTRVTLALPVAQRQVEPVAA